MRIYFDPSALVRLYVAEPGAESTVQFFENFTQTVLLDPLQEFEMRNSIRQKVVREEITEGEAIRSLRFIDDDIVKGRLVRKAVEWAAVFAKAEELSRKLALKEPCRAFDLLHIAIGAISRVRQFATVDTEQARMARLAGLKVTTF